MANNEYKKVQLGPKSETIPKDWDVKKIEEIFELKAGGDVDKEKLSEERDEEHPYPIYANSLENKGLYGFSSECTYPDDCVTITGRGDLGHAVYRDHKFNAIVRLIVLIPNQEIDCRFVSAYVNGKVDFPQESTGVPQLTRPQVSKSRICVPPLPEQRRIADILSTVDEQIQQTDDLIEATKELKQGLMQNVFNINTTEKTGKSEILNNVQKESLGDLVEVVSGVHVKSEHVTDDSSETAYLTGPADFEHRGFSVTKYTDKTSKFCEPGDTLVTVKGSGCGNSTFATQKAGISRQLKALRPGDSLDEHYLYYYLQTKTELLSILAQGTSIPGLSTSDLTTLTIPLPELDAQQRIGEIFATIDDQITEERERKQYLKDLKRGLMQDLLTGKRRVDPEKA